MGQVEDTHRPRTSARLPGGCLCNVCPRHQGASRRKAARPDDTTRRHATHATAALVTGERRCRMRGVGEMLISGRGETSIGMKMAATRRGEMASAIPIGGWVPRLRHHLGGGCPRLRHTSVGRWVATTWLVRSQETLVPPLVGGLVDPFWNACWRPPSLGRENGFKIYPQFSDHRRCPGGVCHDSASQGAVLCRNRV